MTSDGDGDGIRLRAVEGDEGNVRVRANDGSEQLFSRSLFDRIQVDAGAGDDDITIDLGPIFTNGEPTTVSLGPGNDVFRGANGDDSYRHTVGVLGEER